MAAHQVKIPADDAVLEGLLALPAGTQCLVLFAHGSGGSRLSPHNGYVAETLRAAGMGTLLVDLMTGQEDQAHATRFEGQLLTHRLLAATLWAMEDPRTRDLDLAYFGGGTGVAAVLQTAAELGTKIRAVVTRGGRTALTADTLDKVRSPTRLIVGGRDEAALDLNRQTYAQLQVEAELVIIPGAGHLFEEPGALEEVARLAVEWFRRHLSAGTRAGGAHHPTG